MTEVLHMPTLRELQHDFARHLLDPRVPAQASVEPLRCYVPTAVEAESRLALYRNTCLMTLTNALGLSFPAVRQLVGADFFAATAQQFIRAQPPLSAYLNDYGGEFAQFLRRCSAVDALGYLPEVAQLEWAVNRALHAADRPHLDPVRLAQLSLPDMAQLALIPHPSLSILHCRHPVDRIWRTVLEQDEVGMRGIDLSDGPVWLLVERDREELLQLRRLRPAVGQFLERLCQLEPIEAALAGSLVLFADEQWHEILAEQLAAGRFTDFELVTMTSRSVPKWCGGDVTGGHSNG